MKRPTSRSWRTFLCLSPRCRWRIRDRRLLFADFTFPRAARTPPWENIVIVPGIEPALWSMHLGKKRVCAPAIPIGLLYDARIVFRACCRSDRRDSSARLGVPLCSLEQTPDNRVATLVPLLSCTWLSVQPCDSTDPLFRPSLLESRLCFTDPCSFARIIRSVDPLLCDSSITPVIG